MNEVLVLNAAYMPLSIVSWQEAICLWYTNKAEILESYDDKMLRSWSTAMNMPCVIRLLYFIKPRKNIKFFQPFTRRNVYVRDHGKCAYCGSSVSLNKFTFDHVVPKSRGGSTNWNNIVCSCLKCNSKKNNRLPEEAGMKILQKPYAPLLAEDFTSSIMNKFSHITNMMNNEKWRQFIYWNVELDQDK
jgi:5-methylcytosine-specific restriction endonuclease McrA